MMTTEEFRDTDLAFAIEALTVTIHDLAIDHNLTRDEDMQEAMNIAGDDLFKSARDNKRGLSMTYLLNLVHILSTKGIYSRAAADRIKQVSTIL